MKTAEKVGFHTPELTKAIIDELTNNGFKANDLSWHNDEMDSINLENKAQLWVARKGDELFDFYSLVPCIETEGEGEDMEMVDFDFEKEVKFDTLEDLMKHIKNNY